MLLCGLREQYAGQAGISGLVDVMCQLLIVGRGGRGGSRPFGKKMDGPSIASLYRAGAVAAAASLQVEIKPKHCHCTNTKIGAIYIFGCLREDRFDRYFEVHV